MDNFQENSKDGLVEGVGQELEPYGPPSSAPMKPQDGQWSFRFNHADAKKVSVFVGVNFGPPFSISADLKSEMNKSQVETLKNWLESIHRVMTPE